MNQSQTLEHLNPPKVNKKKPGYVTRGKNKKRTSNMNNQLMSKSQPVRKKGRFQGRNPKNNDSPIPLALEVIPFAQEASPKAYQEAPEEPSGHDQEDSRKEDNVLASINMSMVNTSIASSLRPTLVVVDVDESYKAGEELCDVEPPLNVLSSYNFVG